MSRVITFSRTFPAYHPKAGKPTHFVEKITKGLLSLGLVDPFDEIEKFYDTFYEYEVCNPKWHTIRSGHRWKVGDKFSPRVWSGKPYASKQIVIAPDIEIKKIWDFEIKIMESELLVAPWPVAFLNNSQFVGGKHFELAKNDGLDYPDLVDWFQPKAKPTAFDGQIICWNGNIYY